MITGANQGGKSTLLRSVGLAQLMMQCGMFVGGQLLRANVCAGVFTHYKREEDAAMQSGKLDEELEQDERDRGPLTPRADPAVQRVVRLDQRARRLGDRAPNRPRLLDGSVKVLFVTHMYDFAHSFHAPARSALFLRAEREPDGGAHSGWWRASRSRPATARTLSEDIRRHEAGTGSIAEVKR